MRRAAGPDPGGADGGEEVERLARAARGIDAAFFRRRVDRGVERSEDDAVAFLHARHRGVGEGRSLALQAFEADLGGLELEAQVEALVRGLHDGLGRGDDFRPDAVTLEYEDFHSD